jgi:catechol 2,3-dioxygenase-like lactoylglutathione lyase family enzyme
VGGTVLSIGTTVLGVNDVARAAAFWQEALGYVPREDGDDTWIVLVPGSGEGARLALMLSESPVQEHPRIHLDLYADDQGTEVQRLLGLGAELVDWDLYPEDPDFVVLADPDGNRFCVVDAG